MQESVKILIDAEDRATAKLRSVTDDIRRQSQFVKKVGDNSTAAANGIASLADAVGASGIGSFASELGQLTGEIGGFADMANGSASAATLFRGALIGLAGAAGVGLGVAIQQQIVGVDQFKRELAQAAVEAQRLNAALLNRPIQQFERGQEKIGLIDDPVKQQAALEAQKKTIGTQLDEKAKEVKRLTDLLNKSVVGGEGNQGGQVARADLEKTRNARRDLMFREKELDILRSQQKVLQEKTSLHAKEMVKIQADKAKQAIVAVLKNQADAAKLLTGELTKQDLLSRDLIANTKAGSAAREQGLKAIQQIADAEKRAAEKQAKLKQKSSQLRKQDEAERIRNQLVNAVKLETIQHTHGQEAARAFELRMKGLDDVTAKSIAKAETGLDKIRKLKDATGKVHPQDKKGILPAIQATESRLLIGHAAKYRDDQIRGGGLSSDPKLHAIGNQQVDLLGQVIEAIREIKPVVLNEI